MLSDYRLFWKQFRQRYHTTGAVMPSGRALGRALARFIGRSDRPQRVLEVGPGTGAVTRQIVARLGHQDTLDLVELNERFVARLRERFSAEPAFQAVAGRARVLHQPIEAMAGREPYDLIVSSLPLNNFAVAAVEQILGVLRGLLVPGGTFSFFEYIAIRQTKAAISRGSERQRLRGIGRALDAMLGPHEIRRDWVWPNVPPAWVHHVRWPVDEPGHS